MAVTALGTTAHSTPEQQQWRWRVTGDVFFRMMDYEPVGKNQRCTHNNPFTHSGVGQLPQSHWWFGKCGRELRAEIHYNVYGYSDGSVIVNKGRVLLFEGASENTTDLDGSLSFGWPGVPGELRIPDGQSATRTYRVSNAMESEPDDKADVTITFRNPQGP